MRTSSTDGITSDKLYGLDLSDTGQLAFELDTEATKYPFSNARVLTSTRQDQQQGNMWSLQDCSHRQTPRTLLTDSLIQFEFGASDIPTGTPTYAAPVTFDIATQITRSIAERQVDISVTGSPRLTMLTSICLVLTSRSRRQEQDNGT